MELFHKYLSILILTGFLVSCGTGGGDSGSSGSIRSFGLEDSSEIRGIVSGDYAGATGVYTYRRSGYSTETADVAIEETNAYGGINVVVKTVSEKITSRSTGEILQTVIQNYFSRKYGSDYLTFVQGNDKNFYAVNALSGTPDITADVINNGSASTYFTYDTCSSYQTEVCSNRNQVATKNVSYTKIGTETVTTKLGNFQTYKIKYYITQTSNNTDAFPNVSASGTAWFYPSLGNVKQEFTIQNSDYSPVSTLEGSISLSSTNISRFSRNNEHQNYLPQFLPLNINGLPKRITE